MKVAFWAIFAVAVIILAMAITGFRIDDYFGNGAFGASVAMFGHVHGFWIGTDFHVGGIY